MRPIYLDTAPDATFAIVHSAQPSTLGATGVVFCPPFGWGEECTHRARRAWAQELARAGHPAIRIDLPGTCDSPGSPSAPGRLSAWTASVAAAASWLRHEFACVRVCAVGIGFGGMLAWLAAADGAPIDDLVLWGAHPTGRKLARELRIAAKLEIDVEVRLDAGLPPDVVSPDPAEEGGLLDESGQLLSNEILESLGAVDLRRTPLPDAKARRILVFERTGVTSDAELVEHLRAQGATVEVAAGDGYESMMRYVQTSKTPHDAIRRSRTWLASVAEPSSVPERGSAAPRAVRASERVSFSHHGTVIRETPISLRLPSGTIRGVVTQPAGREQADLTVVFISGGADRRIGPNRMWVDQARDWAARGVSAVRIDPMGIGDSDGDERYWDRLREHYRPQLVDSTVTLLNALAGRGLPDRFVLVGFCAGAFRSVRVALRDPRIAGAFAIALPFFRWSWWTVYVRDSWLRKWRPKGGDSPKKIKLASTLQRGLRVVHEAQHSVVRLGQHIPNLPERAMIALDAQGTELLLLVRHGSYANEQLSQPQRRKRLRSLTRARVAVLPGDDVRVRPLLLQRFIKRELDAAMTRVIDAERAELRPAA